MTEVRIANSSHSLDLDTDAGLKVSRLGDGQLRSRAEGKGKPHFGRLRVLVAPDSLKLSGPDVRLLNDFNTRLRQAWSRDPNSAENRIAWKMVRMRCFYLNAQAQDIAKYAAVASGTVVVNAENAKSLPQVYGKLLPAYMSLARTMGNPDLTQRVETLALSVAQNLEWENRHRLPGYLIALRHFIGTERFENSLNVNLHTLRTRANEGWTGAVAQEYRALSELVQEDWHIEPDQLHQHPLLVRYQRLWLAELLRPLKERGSAVDSAAISSAVTQMVLELHEESISQESIRDSFAIPLKSARSLMRYSSCPKEDLEKILSTLESRGDFPQQAWADVRRVILSPETNLPFGQEAYKDLISKVPRRLLPYILQVDSIKRFEEIKGIIENEALETSKASPFVVACLRRTGVREARADLRAWITAVGKRSTMQPREFSAGFRVKTLYGLNRSDFEQASCQFPDGRYSHDDNSGLGTDEVRRVVALGEKKAALAVERYLETSRPRRVTTAAVVAHQLFHDRDIIAKKISVLKTRLKATEEGPTDIPFPQIRNLLQHSKMTLTSDLMADWQLSFSLQIAPDTMLPHRLALVELAFSAKNVRDYYEKTKDTGNSDRISENLFRRTMKDWSDGKELKDNDIARIGHAMGIPKNSLRGELWGQASLDRPAYEVLYDWHQKLRDQGGNHHVQRVLNAVNETERIRDSVITEEDPDRSLHELMQEKQQWSDPPASDLYVVPGGISLEHLKCLETVRGFTYDELLSWASLYEIPDRDDLMDWADRHDFLQVFLRHEREVLQPVQALVREGEATSVALYEVLLRFKEERRQRYRSGTLTRWHT